jgi:phenylalanyl-tRNA synthetase beta chain
MKISYQWLREWVAVELSPRALATTLTMAGLAVDGIEPHGGDEVLELDLTSNRPDALSHLGVAREVAVLCGLPLRQIEEVTEMARHGGAAVRTADLTSVVIEAPDLCPRYTARLIRGVRIGPSPDWLVERLAALGQRSVNNVADITNYVMLEMGQPLHAFDFAQLRGQRIVVRRAMPGEQMMTLDGEERTLTPEMLVIADAERAVAIGGIKGGEDSGITDQTVDVLLEAAWFAPAQIRQTSRLLGLATEASYRFERGTDPEIVARASDRASRLIAEIAGGEILDGRIDVYPGRDAIESRWQPIPFRLSRYQALTGLTVELAEAARILRALGCRVESGTEELVATPPSWRIDLRIEEDLIEEVVRVVGYDQLATTLPGSAGAGSYLTGEVERRAVRQLLTAAGYSEAISFSFVNAPLDAVYSAAGETERLQLLDPIDETQSHMRTTLLGGLLRALEHNLRHGMRNIRLFEIGKCFLAGGGEEGRPAEIERLALIATGAYDERDWQNASARLDFYDLKGLLSAIPEQLARSPFEMIADTTRPWLHPGRSAEVRLADGTTVGFLGQLHPRLAAPFKLVRQPILLAELDLARLLASPRLESRYRPLPKYPTVVRDLALLIERAIPYRQIEEAIRALNLPHLVGIRLFDRYEGKELPSTHHSLAITLRYQALDRTLTDEEIADSQSRLIDCLVKQFAAVLR